MEMKDIKMLMITDLQYGSTGKGVVAGYMARMALSEGGYIGLIGSTNNLPSSGHTIHLNGEKFVSKVLPVSCFVASRMGFNNIAYIGANSVFSKDRLVEELDIINAFGKILCSVSINSTAVELIDRDVSSERSSLLGIASTMSGGGEALCRKIKRGYPSLIYSSLPGIIQICQAHKTPAIDIYEGYVNKPSPYIWIHEGTQGFSLSINHGFYPYCTNHDTTIWSDLAGLGLPFNFVSGVIGVVRPYPIRVGNIIGGWSGPCYDDQKEISWDDVVKECGYDGLWQDAVYLWGGAVTTTVTKRIRRVFTFSDMQFKMAFTMNAVSTVALTFANHLDWNITGIRGVMNMNKLDDEYPKVAKFVRRLNILAKGDVVSLIGTSPDCEDFINLKY